MSKNLAMFSVVIVLGIIGLVFVVGCDEEATAASGANQSVCQKASQATCPKTLDSSQKAACGLKTNQACPPDCKMVCCAAKQKAGTCPLKDSDTNCPKVCPKKCDAL